MKTRWIILLYHNVSWEDNLFTNRIGGTCAPDLFEHHIKMVSKYGDIVSIEDGLNLTRINNKKDVLFSFWFDDGFRGVRKYAMPILLNNGMTGAISICSKFINKDELFWRMKLSFIESVDGMRFLRSKLRKAGYLFNSGADKMRTYSIDNFSRDFMNILDEVYNNLASDILKKDSFRLFDNVNGLKVLKENNWTIANHSASHYPISEEHYIDYFMDEFNECDKFIKDKLNIDTKYWVLPFDRLSHRSNNVEKIFNNMKSNKILVNVGRQINTYKNIEDNRLYRFGIQLIKGETFEKYIKSLLI